MVKVVLILAALVGSVVCEAPLGFGLGLNLNLGGPDHHHHHAQPVLAAGYAGGHHHHQPALIAAGGYGAPAVTSYVAGGYAGGHPGHHPGQFLVSAPARLVVSPVHVNTVPLAYGPPPAAVAAPSALTFATGFDFNIGGGHGGYDAAVVSPPPVGVVKKAVISSHNYDLAPFKPIVGKALYKAPHSEFSITPSISYGYSYKLVPTNSYGPVHSHPVKAVKAPAKGGHASFGFDVGFDLGGHRHAHGHGHGPAHGHGHGHGLAHGHGHGHGLAHGHGHGHGLAHAHGHHGHGLSHGHGHGLSHGHGHGHAHGLGHSLLHAHHHH